MSRFLHLWEIMQMSSSSRFNYTLQMLIARKFNSHFSFELTPTFIHYNLVTYSVIRTMYLPYVVVPE